MKTTHARLIDLEGVTMCEIVVDGRPPCIYMQVEEKITLLSPHCGEEYIPCKRIEYRRERETGDGVWVYRRVTGPWG
jgi:hypothetical protein